MTDLAKEALRRVTLYDLVEESSYFYKGLKEVDLEEYVRVSHKSSYLVRNVCRALFRFIGDGWMAISVYTAIEEPEYCATSLAAGTVGLLSAYFIEHVIYDRFFPMKFKKH